MGSGSSKSRPGSGESVKDEDEFRPIKNWQGEVIGWVERTNSDKMRRRQLKNPTTKARQRDSSDEDEHWRSPGKRNFHRSARSDKTYTASSNSDGGSYRSDDSDRSRRRSTDDENKYLGRRFNSRSRSHSKDRHDKLSHSPIYRRSSRSISRDRGRSQSPNFRRRSRSRSTSSKRSQSPKYGRKKSRSPSLRRQSNSKSPKPSRKNTYDSKSPSPRHRSRSIGKSSENSPRSTRRDKDSPKRSNKYLYTNTKSNGRKPSRSRSRSHSRNRSKSSDSSNRHRKSSLTSSERKLKVSDKYSIDYRRNSRSLFSHNAFSDDITTPSSASSMARSYEGRHKRVKYKPIRKYPTPKATLQVKSKFNRDNSVSLIYKAVKGMGTNEKIIIDVLGSLTSSQRQEVRKSYMMRYRKELIDVMHDELSGEFEDICVALVTDDLAFDVRTVQLLLEHESRHLALIGLMSKTSSNGLTLIRKRFKIDNEMDLMKKIDRETRGAFTDVFKALFADQREGGKKPDHSSAQNDAQSLIEMSRKKDKPAYRLTMLDIIKKRNANQIRELCEAFRQLAGKEITEVNEAILGVKTAIPYNACLESCDDTACFFAGCLHHCFEGIGTDDVTLIRIVVSRCEMDLQDIADAYEEMYKQSLADAIKKETSGDYLKMLLKLLNANDTKKTQK